jgi:hypothetical protein
MLAGYHFLKALFVLPAQLVHPPRCSVFQFGMIFVFPGTGSGFNGLELAKPHELFFSGLGQEFATASFAHDGVNSSYQLLRNDNVSSSCVHGSSPSVISKSHFKSNKKWEYVNER